jgi:hypothetical protein
MAKRSPTCPKRPDGPVVARGEGGLETFTLRAPQSCAASDHPGKLGEVGEFRLSAYDWDVGWWGIPMPGKARSSTR